MPNVKQKHLPIIVFTHEFFPKKGGIAISLQALLKEASELGHSVKVFAPSSPQLKFLVCPYAVTPMKIKGTQRWRCRMVCAKHLLAHRKVLDEAILFLPEPGPIRLMMYLQFLKGIRPKKMIVQLHGSEINKFASAWHRKWLFKILLTRVDRVSVYSQHMRDLLFKHFPEAQGKTVLTPCALRDTIAVDDCIEREDKECVEILTVARVHPRKGQLAILKAMKALPLPLRAKVVYKIVGPVIRKDYCRKLQRYAERHGLNTVFVGEVEDAELGAFYKGADIFAMTSEPYKYSIEGFGLSYLEASAWKLPVVAYNTGGVEDAVKDGETGFLIEPGAIAHLASALERLVRDAKLRSSLGEAGHQYVKKFSWKKNAELIFA